MKKKKLQIKKGLILAAVSVMAIMAFCSCGKKKKLNYGDTKGVVSGNITLNENGADFKLDNVIAPAGTDIDYTSAIVTSGEGDDYSVEVNASNVKYDKPGTYTAQYKVKSGNNTYTDSIKVTITDNKNSSGDISNADVSNNNANVGDNFGGSDNSGNNSGGSGNSGNNDNPVNQGGNSNPPSGGNNNSGNGGGNANQGQNPPTETTGKKVLITNGETVTYEKKDIPNAVIELLSGDVVTISCSTSKYIVSTRTEETQAQRNGHNYKVTKLIVTFNTGKEQTLETIEKRID